MDGSPDQKHIREIVQFLFGDVGLLVNVAMEAEIPALIGPVGIGAGIVSKLQLRHICSTTHGIFSTWVGRALI